MNFNLIDEPWMPCVLANGDQAELGLRGTLFRAHEIREIFHSSPLVTVSLHRLLLAVLHRALMGPTGIAQWNDLWTRGHWESVVVDSYLEHWRHRFDLFDPDRPFYQVPFITDLAEPKQHQSIAILEQESSAGNNAALFDHQSDEAPRARSASEVARYLVARQAFSIGFGKSSPFYLKDSPLIRGFSVLAFGDSLFETLALNLQPYTAERPIPWLDADRAAWEFDEPRIPEEAGTPARGYVDYLTWQSRAIYLIQDASTGMVSRCQIRQHLKLANDGPVDPFKCYLPLKLEGIRPASMRVDRALWRDSHVLLQNASSGSRRPALMNWLARIDGERRRGAIAAGHAYTLGGFGIATDEGKAASIILWRAERLPLPLAYLQNDDLVQHLRDVLTLAEEVARTVRGAGRDLAKLLLAPSSNLTGERQADPKSVDALFWHIGIDRQFWPALDEPFKRLLVDLPNDLVEEGDGESSYGRSVLPRWAEEVKHAAKAAFVEVANGLGSSGRSLKSVAIAERGFTIQLAKTVANAGPAFTRGGMHANN